MNQNPEDFLRNYGLALATQNWEAVSPLIREDACVTFSSGSFYVGKTEIQQAFERNFGSIQDEKYLISDIHWVTKSRDYAICIYAFEWHGIINGKLSSGSGRGTSVLICEKGKWFLLSEHLGPNATAR